MADLEGKKSKVYRAVETFGDIFALNIIYLVFSLPLITFGASTTALYSVSMKMVKKEEGPIWKSFIAAFKSNFKKATLAWLFIILVAVVIEAEYIYVNAFTGVIVNIYKVLIIVESLAVILILPFLFPLLAKYENTVFNTIINAFLLSLGNLWPFLKILVAWVMPVFLSFYNIGVFYSTFYIWLIFMFALIAYGTSHTVNKVFSKIEKVQSQKKAENAGEEVIEEENTEDGAEKAKKPVRKYSKDNNRIKTDGSLKNHLYHKKK